MSSEAYARFSRLLTMLPATCSSLAEPLGVTTHTVRCWMLHLKSRGIVRVLRKVRDGLVYARSEAQPYDRAGPASGQLERFCAAWDLLRSRQCSGSLAKALCVHQRTGQDILAAMRRHGLVRVAAWVMRGQTPVALYDRLPGADAVRPAPVSRQAANAAYWAKYSARGAERMAA